MNSISPRHYLAIAAIGLGLGFGLDRMGFTNWGEMHRMFTLADLRLLFTFMGAVAVLALAFPLLRRRGDLPPRPLHRGTLIGGALFGLGWAISGACPGAAFVQVGEGQLAALCTLAGIAVGTVAYRPIHRRFFRWDRGSCEW